MWNTGMGRVKYCRMGRRRKPIIDGLKMAMDIISGLYITN